MQIYANDLVFSYGETLILDHINLSITAQESVAIVGPSGCGKSTLLKLLSGLYLPQLGTIRVADADKPEEIRRKVAVVMQSPMLFPTSIRENITCGHPMKDSHIQSALEAAQLSEWISTLPQGLDTYVGERGANVSGGQAQRVAIARAIAKDAPVVLLDEATSALDHDTEAAVIKAIDNLTKGKTVLQITHRESMLSICNRVLKLEGGHLHEI